MKAVHARVVLLLTLALVAFAIVRTRPGDRAQGVLESEFSGRVAYGVLESLYKGLGPHPVGSTANATLRDRIVARFRQLGYTPRVQRDFACSRWGRCATVENIVAEIPGRESGKSVLLVSHYDSVPAGPGVADDGSGVAITLEIARILEGSAPRNRIVFLITDGEEGGLLGAEAFVAHDAAAKQVGAVVNLESRGTSGSSYMFETNRDNAWVVTLLSHALARPATSSLFYTIYEQLPNDTDFSVFKRAGMQGANFAFIGHALRYHTPLDDLAHLSRATLHAQGANALAMLRAFAESDLMDPPAGNATYFDVFQLLVIAWPASWSILVAGGALLLLALQIAILERRDIVRYLHVFSAAGAVLLSALVAGGVGYGGTVLLEQSGAFPDSWVARPAAAVAFFWIVGIFSATAAALPSLRNGREASFWSGSGLLVSILGVAAALAWPGISFLFIVPSIAYALVASLWLASTPGASVMRWIAPVTAAAVSLLPVAALLYQGMGLPAMPAVATFSALIAATFAIPILVASSLRGRVLLLLGSLAVAAIVTATMMPPWSVDSPRPLNFAYELREDGTARWLTSASHGPLPQAVARAASWGRAGVVALPSNPNARYFEASAPAVNLPRLAIETSATPAAGGRRAARLAIRNAPAEARVVVAFHDRGTIESVHVNGLAVPFDERRRDNAWTTVTLLTPGAQTELTLAMKSEMRIETIVQLSTKSLPHEGAALLKARPADAVPIQSGDVTLVTQRLEL